MDRKKKKSSNKKTKRKQKKQKKTIKPKKKRKRKMQREVAMTAILAAMLTGTAVIDAQLSNDRIGERAIGIEPGSVYTVGRRAYTVPELPFEGALCISPEPVLCDLRALLRRALRCCAENGIAVELAGQTLLGFIRHGTLVPWATDIRLRTGRGGSKAIADASVAFGRAGLEILRGCSTADPKTVRIRAEGTYDPVCDVADVESIDPQSVHADGLVVPVPKDPRSEVVRQCGADAFVCMRSDQPHAGYVESFWVRV